MKKILHYLIDYQRNHFDVKLYVSITLFLTVSLAFNYYLDFEDGYIDQQRGPIKWFWMFLFQGLPFLVVSILISYFDPKNQWFRQKSFWICFVLGFGIIAIDRAYSAGHLFYNDLPRLERGFLFRIINWLSSLIFVVLPLVLLYPFLENDKPKTYYGLALKRFDPKPYLILLALTGVVLGLGSFLADIQEFYPRYLKSKGDMFAASRQLPEWVAVGIYEFTYGLDFISVEMFFRGFLVFAFTRTLGPKAVLAMVASYCYLHFGKPLGESISSIFGGYILGIVSLNSRNIWGGIMIHVGVAWLMEFFGYLQRILK
ncbi:MAG: CPBP family intramembrane metalloprotease [Cyclobacteriaceae bacterium]|nr:CPBP family intramembrane metalloprotease [Cyclobacteriaceae bacterium HetDA_MAG_MS6]